MLRYLLCLLVFSATTPAWAVEALLPAGTQVYLEPVDPVSSKRGESEVGDVVNTTVWRNVVADGYVVIEAGAPAVGKISEIKHRNVAGKKGQLRIAAISVRGVDGREILLDGGYHEAGKSRVALSVSLFLLVAWPLIFIPGKNAELGPGNIFDGEVQVDTPIDVSGAKRVPAPSPDDERRMRADVMYAVLEGEKKPKTLPIEIHQCAGEIPAPRIVTLNDLTIEAVELEPVRSARREDCWTVETQTRLKPLMKQFSPGINRFEVESNGERAEVIFQVEI